MKRLLEILSFGVLSIGLLLSFSTCLSGQGVATTPKTIVDIAYQRFVLPNGLTLIVHEDHKAPLWR
jgi:zinc protease